MRAIITEQAGGIENLIMQEVAKPEPGADEVLVETRAISINPADTKVKYVEEVLTQLFGPDRPITLGWDIAGVVVADSGSKAEFIQNMQSAYPNFGWPFYLQGSANFLFKNN